MESNVPPTHGEEPALDHLRLDHVVFDVMAGEPVTPDTLQRLVRVAHDAATAAVALERSDHARAARAISVGSQLLGRGRIALAETTLPGDGPVAQGEWEVARDVVEQQHPRLAAHPGVVGTSIGLRPRSRADDSEQLTATVYVERKLPPEALAAVGRQPLPPSLPGPTGAIPVAVVEIGSIEYYADAGTSTGPLGTKLRGTIGAFATHLPTNSSVALTAMHVSGRDEVPPGPRMTFTSPAEQDDPAAPILGELIRGTRQGVDAAMIQVLQQNPGAFSIEGIGRIRGWRPVVLPDDRGTVVRMRGAASGRVLTGQITDPAVHLSEPDLLSAILVDIPAVKGDSGATIVDSCNLILGLLVGRPTGMPHTRVFTPISLVLRALDCEIPTQP